jgi:hypothetical protein
MQQGLGKTSSRLVAKQRRQTREYLFARNKRYHQMTQGINE